ncbi:hypothetical protein K8T06_12215 [bacterium]|nr:hypothetical protein [bacterium]
MKEYDLIREIAKKFPRSKFQKNALFECDSEIILIGNEIWGMSMDEFSSEEDLFTAEDPVRLGNNLTVATLSDLFAAGVEPKFFMHSISLPRDVEREFIDGLMDGIRKVLAALGCALCGGDIGTADPWRFCGFGMGPVASAKALTHRLPIEPQQLWITGKLGDANLAALQKTQTPEFELRNKETQLIRSCASGCIDTSGGLFDALWILHGQNPQLRFDIRMDNIPLAEGIDSVAKAEGFPRESVLLGGAGEYELLFAVLESDVSRFINDLLSIGATSIGTIRQHRSSGIYVHRYDGLTRIMTEAPPCPREAANIEEHVGSVITMARSLFGSGKAK